MLALVLYLVFLIAAPAGVAVVIQHAFPAPDEAAFVREVRKSTSHALALALALAPAQADTLGLSRTGKMRKERARATPRRTRLT